MTNATATANKNNAISEAIKNLIESGVDIKEAFNSVLGEGAFDKMAGDVYDQLQAV